MHHIGKERQEHICHDHGRDDCSLARARSPTDPHRTTPMTTRSRDRFVVVIFQKAMYGSRGGKEVSSGMQDLGFFCVLRSPVVIEIHVDDVLCSGKMEDLAQAICFNEGNV